MKSPTPQALEAARIYLRQIDGSDFGNPEHGHNVHDAAKWIDRGANLPKLLKALEAARGPLQHIAHFAAQWERKPLKHTHDEFYGIHSGTEFEATLKLSELHKAIDALKRIEAVLPHGKTT